MGFEVNPALVALFGSETRVRALAPLANSSRPLTAYRIAKMTGAQRIRVYSELRKLAAVGIVREVQGSWGRSEWELVQPDLRNMLRKTARIVSMDEWREGRVERSAITKRVMEGGRRVPVRVGAFTNDQRAKFEEEFSRPREKDVVLKKLGLKTSRYA
jgi:predicted transcriptional regulator